MVTEATDWNCLHQHISNAERVKLIGHVLLENIIAAPGHRELRNPEALKELSQQIYRGENDEVFREPILLGIFTTGDLPDVALRSIECIDGHHRLLAGFVSGYWDRIGDLPANTIETRVNGCPADSADAEKRWVPLAVAERSSLGNDEWEEVPQAHGAKGPTAAIDGRICSLDAVFCAEDRGIRFAQLERRFRFDSNSSVKA